MSNGIEPNLSSRGGNPSLAASSGFELDESDEVEVQPLPFRSIPPAGRAAGSAKKTKEEMAQLCQTVVVPPVGPETYSTGPEEVSTIATNLNELSVKERHTVFRKPSGVPAGGDVPCKVNVSALVYLPNTVTRHALTLTIQTVRPEPLRVILDAPVVAHWDGVGDRRLARDAVFLRRLDRTGGVRSRRGTGSGDDVDGEWSGGCGRRSREAGGGQLGNWSWNGTDKRDERGEHRSEHNMQVHHLADCPGWLEKRL